MHRVLILSLLVYSLASCEKAISFNPSSAIKQPVVEATIEKGEHPRVILTTSFDYFGYITPEILSAIFIHNAVITISNETETLLLKEYSMNVGSTSYRIYYYTIDSAIIVGAFRGEEGKTYTLNIKIGDKEYTSSTTIPPVTWTLDSLWWRVPDFAADSNRAIVTAKLTDRIPYGNSIRYATKRNREAFLSPETSAFDDQVVNGTTYNIDIEPGFDRNDPPPASEPNLFYRGDTVTVKWSNIDQKTFRFWNTLEFNWGSVGNPFSSPIRVSGNINGGAFGYFGGYNSMYRTIIIPPR